MKIIKKIIIVILVFCFFDSTLYAEEDIPQELTELYARSAVLMDADSGRVLFGKNETNVMPMASTTKIMTCILVLENVDLMEEAYVSDYAQRQPKVHLGVREGEKYLVKDLLYSLMLESHNDSAVVLAEHVAGSVDEFADLMNQKAKEIGCSDTYFITPNGLDATDQKGVHSTTTTDLANIMRYCINVSEKKSDFLEITRTASYQFEDLSGIRSFSCTNRNAFLEMMDGALSGKTGFTADAGYCYVGALKREGKTFIVALLACGWPNNKNYKWADTKTLMTYGLENYEYRDIWEDVELSKVKVINGVNEAAPFEKTEPSVELEVKDSPTSLELLVKEDESPRIELDVKECVEAPIKQGETLGVLRYWVSDVFLGEWEIVSVEQIEGKTFGWVLREIINCFLL